MYSAGYARTRAAAARFEHEPALRRPAPEAPERVARAMTPSATPAAPRAVTEPANDAPRVSAPVKVAEPAVVTHTAVAPAVKHEVVAEPVTKAEPAPATLVADSKPAPETKTALADAPPATAEATPAAAPPVTKAVWKDGTFSGWGTSRHGDIEATVVIESGRIVSATITQCLTRYSCQWIAHLQGQVVTRQSADVDYVSGATQSTDAFYYAVVDALSKAR